MINQFTEEQECINWRILVLLCFLLFLVYINTFNASWHLDDFHNITQNPRIQIKDLYPVTLYNAVLENTGKNKVFHRPVSNFSFAVNWHFSQANVSSYHVVNTFVHILAAFFLYLTVLVLLKTPNLSGKYHGSEHFIALLATVLWAANPIQTQALTYIVQRMASMAAMFYILGIYLYINARIGVLWKRKVLLYTGVVLAFLLAVGSKENALMFPVSLFLVEMVFFQDIDDPKVRKRVVWVGCALAGTLFVIGVTLFMGSSFIERLQNGYTNRTFTFAERLLTQPRIVIFYISQIFYPIADRLSVVHDFEISTGLFRPWTTLPAIMLILGSIGTALWKINKYPLISFAILFFFLNHVIESSIIPLELVFEHRNYLPSLFLFVPVAAGLKWAIDYYAWKKKSMATVIIAFVTLLVMALGIGTYVRNMAWVNERTLWQDALEKAPGSARPYHNLAAGYYSKIGNYAKAKQLCEKAMNLYDSTQHKAKVLSMENIANAYAKKDQDYEKVAKIYKQVLEINPDRQSSRYHLVLALTQISKFDEALEHNIQLLLNQPERIEYLNTKSFIHLKKNEPEKALPILVKAIRQNPDDERVNLSMGKTKSMLSKHKSAKHFLSRIPDRSSRRITALLLLIENAAKAGNQTDVEKYAEKLISKAGPKKISKIIQKANEPGLTWPVSAELVSPVIADVLRQQSMDMTRMGGSDADES